MRTVSSNISKLLVTSLIELSLVKNLKSFINEIEIIFDEVVITVLNTLFIYIRNKIGDTDKPYSILVFTSLSKFLCLSMMIFTFLSIRKDYV